MKKAVLLLLVLAAFMCSGLKTDYVNTTESYTVKSGDTLWYIAGKYFDKQDKEDHFGEFQWQIREANADKFADNRSLQPGDVLIIPLSKRVE